MPIRVCVAGATGWAGSALAKAIAEAPDMQLVGAVSRTYAGKPLADALDIPELKLLVSGTAEQAVQTPTDVFVEYTHPTVARQNILHALEAGAHVVVGTSGLTDEDYAAIDQLAQSRGLGVLAAGNFALTVVLLQKFAEMAARYIPQWEIIDYADSEKIDAPSGTARELAHRLGQVGESTLDIPLDEIEGERESRGLRLNGSQVHSIRLPGYVLSVEAIFGMPGQKLILRHESGATPEPYVDGAMLAIRQVSTLTGLSRGLDSVMDF